MTGICAAAWLSRDSPFLRQMADAKPGVLRYNEGMITDRTRQLSLAQLAQSCRDEQAQSADGPCCFELICRALDQNDSGAWQAFEAQFQKLFTRWIVQDAAHYNIHALTPEDTAELWAEARARFIARYGGTRRVGEHFPHIGAVLAVLRKCIRSTLQERQRARARQQRLDAALREELLTQRAPHPMPATQAELAELRECVQHLLRQDVPEDELRLLLDLRFGLDLKPRQIQAQHSQQFPTVRAVHAGLDKVLKRLKRRLDVYMQRCM